MALSLLAANNAQSVLAAGISSSATTLTINTGTGLLFPTPVDGTSYFKLTLVDAATGTLTEIVHVTARTSDTMTITRAQEGTVSRAWSANDIVANMMTAGTLSYILGNFQPLDATLTALAALAGAANKLPYFNGDDTAALTDLTAFARELLGLSDAAGVLSKLGLQAFNTTAEYSSVSAPTGGVFFYIAPSGEWGVQDSAGNPLPLGIAHGGTGANTLLGARVQLNIAAFGGDSTHTTMSSPQAKVFLYIDDAGNWGVQDSAGHPLPLKIANGGTGANTLLGARTELGIAAFGSAGGKTTMTAPGSPAYIFVDDNGEWGAESPTEGVIALPVSRGGTGSVDAASARTSLGLGTAATKNVGTQAGQIPDMSAFQYSATAHGYEKMPNGMLRQWGSISIPAANDSTNVALDTFQIPFPNGVLSCRVNGTDTLTNTPCFATAEAVSKTQIRIKAVAIDLQNKSITQGMAVNVAWEVIGA